MRKLPVPVNISLRQELFPGFGRPEAVRTAAVMLVAISVGVTFCLVSTWPPKLAVTMMTEVFALFLCIGLFSKLDYNQSIYDHIRRRRAFCRTQQRFLFKRAQEEVRYVKEADRH